MDELEETKKKLNELKKQKSKLIWDNRFDFINKNRKQLAYSFIVLLLCVIIFNQVTEVKYHYYAGEIENTGVTWKGGMTKTAHLWINFKYHNNISFNRYNYDVFGEFENNKTKYIGNKVMIAYEEGLFERRLVSIVIIL